MSGRLPRRRQHLTTPMPVPFRGVSRGPPAPHSNVGSCIRTPRDVVQHRHAQRTLVRGGSGAGGSEGRGTEEQARTSAPLRIHRGLGMHLNAPHPPVPICRQLLVRAARARLEEAEKMELAGEAGGLAPVGRTADAPSPHACSKPMQHSRESVLLAQRECSQCAVRTTGSPVRGLVWWWYKEEGRFFARWHVLR
ncbi:hypothetical protein B0H10DRAFT_1944819 [Mycena sp. CBHHK59/15]|nr:hypothetical protein B0H10DRAFT_1944819 [Mycena sp. CBHHK59/15]